MTTETQIIIALTGSILLVALMLFRSAGRDPLGYVAAYFAFFGLGPALNYLLGNDIYIGIAVLQLGPAALGILWALAGMAVVALAFPLSRQPLPRLAIASTKRLYPVVTVLLGLLVAYPVLTVGLAGPAAFVGSKTARIAAAGHFHYQYLLAELLVCSLHFLAVRTTSGRRLYWLNVVVYTAYCLATNERDFLFVLFGLLLYRQLFRPPMGVRLALAGVGAVIAATWLAALRGDEETTSTLVLNQGSIMFTDTFVRTYVPWVEPYQNGQTYIDATMSLLPGWTRPDLAGWLVDLYAPGSSAGYGFSLSAEAYLNFGTIGIPVVFAAFAAIQRALISQVARNQFAAYLALLFTIAWMYGFRGESSTVVLLLLYGIVLFGLVRLLSLRRVEATIERNAHGNVDNRRVVGPDLVQTDPGIGPDLQRAQVGPVVADGIGRTAHPRGTWR